MKYKPFLTKNTLLVVVVLEKEEMTLFAILYVKNDIKFKKINIYIFVQIP